MTKYKNPKLHFTMTVLTAFALMLFLFIFYSCKKTEINYSTPLHDADFVTKFFETKTTPTAEVAAIIKKLKAENDRTGFVNKLPAKCGLPVWDKIVIQKQVTEEQLNYRGVAHGPSVNFASADESSTKIIIPLTITNDDLSSLIIAQSSIDSFNIDCKTTNDYLYNETHGTNVDIVNATNDLALFFYMENLTYGTTKFNYIPVNFFPNSAPLNIFNGTKTVIIKNLDNTTGTGISLNLQQTISIEICTLTGYVNSCGQPWNGDENVPHYEVWDCTTYGGGGGSSGGGGGSGGGSGGGGNPGGGTTGGGGNPCGNNFSWYTANVATGGGGCPPPPPPPPVYVDPCVFILQLQSDQNFISKFYSLNQNSALLADHEKGYQVNSRANNNYAQVQGQSSTPSIEWNIPAGTKVDGFLHCHYDGLNNVFSPIDLINMARTFLLGYAADTANLFMGVTSNIDNPYLIKINNIAKFRAFAVSILGADGNDEGKTKNFEDEYNIKLNSSNPSTYVQDNEVAFLKMINDKLGGDGITMFHGNYQCTQWTKLKLNTNGTISAIDCNQ